MQYEIIPCVDGDAEYIEEQADQATNAIAKIQRLQLSHQHLHGHRP